MSQSGKAAVPQMSKSGKVAVPHMPPQVPQPKELILTCPICMGKLVEETSTKCGHIFCKSCIDAALAAQRKCPTCRRKLRVTDGLVPSGFTSQLEATKETIFLCVGFNTLTCDGR